MPIQTKSIFVIADQNQKFHANKRSISSEAVNIFGSLGLSGSVTILAKLLMQIFRERKSNLGWWCFRSVAEIGKILNQIFMCSIIILKVCEMQILPNPTKIELRWKSTYGAAVFLVSKVGHKLYYCNLCSPKHMPPPLLDSKVLPRLELCKTVLVGSISR